jgi:broad specificity phosphatase PhoE
MGKGPYASWAPGGESWAEFVARTGRALRTLADDHAGETVVVACHGGVIEAALIVLGDAPLGRRLGAHVENTSINEWVHATGPDGVDRWQLIRYNDAAHLQLL